MKKALVSALFIFFLFSLFGCGAKEGLIHLVLLMLPVSKLKVLVILKVLFQLDFQIPSLMTKRILAR